MIRRTKGAPLAQPSPSTVSLAGDYLEDGERSMTCIEDALAQRIVAELTELGVASDMVAREVRCKSGRIDVVVYTQPRCLIELKVSLDLKTLNDAIKKLMVYRRDYQGARLFIWAHPPPH